MSRILAKGQWSVDWIYMFAKTIRDVWPSLRSLTNTAAWLLLQPVAQSPLEATSPDLNILTVKLDSSNSLQAITPSHKYSCGSTANSGSDDNTWILVHMYCIDRGADSPELDELVSDTWASCWVAVFAPVLWWVLWLLPSLTSSEDMQACTSHMGNRFWSGPANHDILLIRHRTDVALWCRIDGSNILAVVLLPAAASQWIKSSKVPCASGRRSCVCRYSGL